jgi:hypothetical protein
MKIISINDKHTKSRNNLAFNVDVPPSESAIERVNATDNLGFTVNFEDDVLHITNLKNNFDSATVRLIDTLITSAENTVKEELQKAALNHENILIALSNVTGLPRS